LRSNRYTRHASGAFLLCLFATAGLACGGSASGPSVTTVAFVTVNAPARNIALGNTAQLSAVAFDQAGDQLVGVTFQWSSSNNAIATVSSAGVVTGVANGVARISAMTGAASGFADVTVGPTMTTQLAEKPIAHG
jgi:uncharacterized protein YjdB